MLGLALTILNTMLKLDVDVELAKFYDNYRRIYRLKCEFTPDHFISVKKIEEEFLLVPEESTIFIENFNKDLFIKMLGKEEIVFETASAYANVTDLRTGGCDMGCWITSNSDLHTFGCKKYVK